MNLLPNFTASFIKRAKKLWLAIFVAAYFSTIFANIECWKKHEDNYCFIRFRQNAINKFYNLHERVQNFFGKQFEVKKLW